MALFLNSPCRCTSRWHASPAWVSCQNKANSWLSGWLSCAMCFVVVHFSGRTTLVSSSEALVIAGLFTWANSPFQANLYFVYICFYFHCEEVVRATYASFLFSFTLLSRKSVQPARRQNNFRSRRSGILCVGVYHFSWVSSAIHSKLDQVYVVVCSHNNQVKCKRNCNKSVLFQTKKNKYYERMNSKINSTSPWNGDGFRRDKHYTHWPGRGSGGGTHGRTRDGRGGIVVRRQLRESDLTCRGRGGR